MGLHEVPSWQLLGLVSATDTDWGIVNGIPDTHWKYKFSVTLLLMFFLLVTPSWFFPHLHLKLPLCRGFLCAWLLTAASCQNKPTYIFLVITSERALKCSQACFVWADHPFHFFPSSLPLESIHYRAQDVRQSCMCPFNQLLLTVGNFFAKCCAQC